ncbi:DUF4178 domain-containing protein [Algibacter sp. R77976]|uniref:DUF4178 domain-containing protein n=1 Tax=Algibacter sp. R77976 TaxID=3093873 RepID=UPI0037C8DD8C
MFGKKENFKLDKLKEGFTLKVKKTTWKIIEIAEYDWSGDGRSIEYIMTSEDNNIEAFLEVEFLKGDYEIYFSQAVSLDFSILKDAINTSEVVFSGYQFSLEEQYKGAYKNLTNRTSWENLKSYMFYNSNEDILTIEDWGNDKFEAFFGEEIKSKNIKNITPN